MNNINRENKNEYQKWVDISKGVGIVLVVLGHSGNLSLHHFIYWFHMPLFFLISGYLFTPSLNFSQLLTRLNKLFRRLLLPYFSYLAIITLLRYFLKFIEGSLDFNWLTHDLLNVIIGGRAIGGWYGPFWFVTTLFFTYIIYDILLLFTKNAIFLIYILFLFYLTAHIESFYYAKHYFVVPFNFDVSLISISYFSFGHLTKNILKQIHNSIFIVCIIFILFFIFTDYASLTNFSLSLKTLKYNHIVYDFFIPTMITIIVLKLSQHCLHGFISDKLAFIGKWSMPIMYLHILPNGILKPILGYGVFFYTFIGISFPILLSYFLFSKFKATRIFFLGKTQ